MQSRNHRPLGARDLFASGWNFTALGFGAGLSKRAPGTCGTIIALPFLLPLQWLHEGFGGGVYAAALAAIALLGVMICARASEALRGGDHPGIVFDEMVGMWLALAFLPLTWWNVALGFALFRLFDIAKPWPISAIDRRIRGGLGIMLDDILAGVFANVVLRVVMLAG